MVIPKSVPISNTVSPNKIQLLHMPGSAQWPLASMETWGSEIFSASTFHRKECAICAHHQTLLSVMEQLGQSGVQECWTRQVITGSR
jgi:hypothetical protein